MKREINKTLLRKCVAKLGDLGRMKLAMKSKVSHSQIDKLISEKYKTVPRELLRQRLAKATGYSENQLFPIVEDDDEQAS